MESRRVTISVDEKEWRLLKAHPEINKSQMFRLAVMEWAKNNLKQEVTA